MSYWNVINFNIMSHSHSSFYFGQDDKKETTEQYYLRYGVVLEIIQFVCSYNFIHIISLEEVTPESYGILFPFLDQFFILFTREITSPSGLGTLLVTGFNKLAFQTESIINLSDDFQKIYNIDEKQEYPSRTQVFQINTSIMYTHLHAPGMPDDNKKSRYFTKVKNFLFSLGDKGHIICGDFNEERYEFLSNNFDNKFSIVTDNRSTSYHRFTRGTDHRYTEDTDKYKKVDQLMLSPSLLVISLQTIYRSSLGFGNHTTGIKGDGGVNPYFQDIQGNWVANYNYGSGWPSDHTLNLYSIMIPTKLSSAVNNVLNPKAADFEPKKFGGSMKQEAVKNDNVVNEVEQYLKYFNAFLEWYYKKEEESEDNSDESIEVSDEQLIQLLQYFNHVDINILATTNKYDTLSTLKDAFNEDNIDEIVNEYIYNLNIFQKSEQYQKIRLNKEYDTLKDYIVTNCTQLLSHHFNISPFFKEDITLLRQFDSDNHGSEYPVLLLAIKDVQLVFKPRPALIDQAIMDLFNKINILNSHQTEFQLPTYRIINCNDYSFWEYIEGKNVFDSGILKIDKLLTNLNRKRNLSILNTVSHKIGLTDLHAQNIILQGDYFIPIDLEVINLGSDSGLYMNESNVVITGPILAIHPNIEQLIVEFNKNVSSIPGRIIPINTTTLIDFVNNNESVTLQSLISEFKTKIPDWQDKDITEAKLRQYFEYCKKDNIIPYFYTQHGKIFMKGFE
jgi:hypothetical protein